MTDIREITIAKNVFSQYRPHPFRPYQAEAIQFCIESPKKIVVLEASTGSGKSLIGLTAGSCMNGVTYLVHSKMLQNQITRDFPEAQSLFGRSNYECLRIPGATCEECTSGPGMACKHHLAYRKIFKEIFGEKDDFPPTNAQPCIYKMRKLEVLMASYRILNYDYFLSEANYIGRFGNQMFVVVDEADSLENTLINFVTLTFTQYALRRIGMDQWARNLKMTSKFKEPLIESWVNFGTQALDRVNNIIKKLNADCKEMANSLSRDLERKMDELKKVVRLKEKIILFLDNVDDTWMLDNQGDRLIFRPLWLTPELANAFFWRHSKKFVLMSASFYPRPILAKTLGLDIDDIDYHMIPSQFPVANRPVYIAPVANLTYKTMDVEIPKLIPAIKAIVDSRPNSKGIIHAVSYTLAHKIVDALNDPRYITHNSTDRQETLDRFMESDEPLILVSPSLERGVSLDGDKARLVIIAKSPYLSLADKIVSARLYSSKLGSDWYKATMMLTVLQMAGRAVRSAEDYAECFILDEQVEQAITSRPGFLPGWFMDAIEFRLPDKPMDR